MNIPTFAWPILTMLRPTFSTPTFNRFLVLLLGTLLTMGRPRVKGQKLASPQEVVADTVTRTRLRVAWYGGTTRASQIVTGTGHWDRIGEDLVEVRGVYSHDGTATHRDESFFTTALTMTPPQLVACYTPRWSIETTLQACREYLQLVSTKGGGQHTVLDSPPACSDSILDGSA